MSFPSEFNRVTFGLPVETFRVDAYIALEERLPVVTEFVLRLLRICGVVNLTAFRNYFGFTNSEALAVIDSLMRQGLLDVVDEDVQLSRFAIERFEESGGDHPRFSKVELRATLNKPSKISAQTWMTQFFGLLCLSRGPFGQFAGR